MTDHDRYFLSHGINKAHTIMYSLVRNTLPILY
jgi:hypothetical protein